MGQYHLQLCFRLFTQIKDLYLFPLAHFFRYYDREANRTNVLVNQFSLTVHRLNSPQIGLQNLLTTPLILAQIFESMGQNQSKIWSYNQQSNRSIKILNSIMLEKVKRIQAALKKKCKKIRSSNKYAILQCVIFIFLLFSLIFSSVEIKDTRKVPIFIVQNIITILLTIDVNIRVLAEEGFFVFIRNFSNAIDVVNMILIQILMNIKFLFNLTSSQFWFIQSMNVVIIASCTMKMLINFGESLCRMVDRKKMVEDNLDYNSYEMSMKQKEANAEILDGKKLQLIIQMSPVSFNKQMTPVSFNKQQGRYQKFVEQEVMQQQKIPEQQVDTAGLEHQDAEGGL